MAYALATDNPILAFFSSPSESEADESASVFTKFNRNKKKFKIATNEYQSS